MVGVADVTTDKKALKLIKDRAKGKCEVCGTQVGEEYDPHHRQLKSRGGKDKASNLLHICHKCHMKIHDQPAWASDKGYMIASWEKPEEMGFLNWRGFWIDIYDDGTQKICGDPVDL